MAESEQVRVAVARHDAVLSALDAGQAHEALRLAPDAMDAAAAAFGADSPELANVVLTYAIAQEEAGDFTAAQSSAERAAEIASPLAGSEDAQLVALWADVEVVCARLLTTLGSLDEAEARLSAALRTAQRILASGDPSVLSIHNARGVAAKYAGRFDDAEVHYQRMRSVLDVEPIADKPALAGLLHNLGGLAHSRGRIAEGLAHAQRGLDLNVEVFGADHPNIARDLNAIGALHHDAGDMVAADAAYRRALRIFEDRLGPDHYEVAMTCANLAVSAATTDDAAAARGLYERSLRILQSLLGSGHPDVALVQHNFAVLLADQGEVDRAVDLLNQASTVFAVNFPPDHPRCIDLHATMAELSPPFGQS